MGMSASAAGLASGGPGCSPPICDDIDALSAFNFSLSAASPSVPGLFAPGDIVGFGPAVVVPAGVLGLTIGDEVDALEATTNPCPIFAGGDPPDFDGVAPGPGCDNCPGTVNPGQEDTDGDLIGDACDPCTDTDADGFGNMDFPANLCPVDLCPFFAGANLDGDGDGWADECDNCPLIPNTGQADTDFDGAGNVCDSCPNVFGAIPSPFNAGTVKKARLASRTTGPARATTRRRPAARSQPLCRSTSTRRTV